MKRLNQKTVLAAAMALVFSAPALATNGMNMEGYGPIATGMGGASMAYDNGTAASMNNPATIGLMESNSRLDLAVGVLKPDITSKMNLMPDAKSSATSFVMPAMGYVRKHNSEFTYGFGVFAQGGMGAEYAADSFLAAGTGEKVRSEVGVGRFLIPLSFKVNNKFIVGGSLDYVWAGMDVKMAMGGAQFADMATEFGGTQAAGSASGTMVTSMANMATALILDPAGQVNSARFDFSNSDDFTGEAKGTGFAGKVGLVFEVNDKLNVGFTYHSKTSLGDLTTKNAVVTVDANLDDNFLSGAWQPFPPTPSGAAAGTYTATNIPVSGHMTVKDFQWPATIGVGAAFKASEKIKLAADVKVIQWSSVMDSFKMRFVADQTQVNPLAAGFADQALDAELKQGWKDQTVISLGGAYELNNALTLRAGYNTSSNPVPENYLNPLFPATVKDHLTLGAGFAISQASSVDVSLTNAFDSTVTSASGVEVSHSQMSYQLMYSHRF